MLIVGDFEGLCFEGFMLLVALVVLTMCVRVVIFVIGVIYWYFVVVVNVVVTIDHIFGGCVEFGVGVVWLEKEYW